MCVVCATSFVSCSNVSDETTEDSVQEQKVAMRDFDNTFRNNFNAFLHTRSAIANASEGEMDSIMIKAGDEACEMLIEPSEKLLGIYGLTSKDFEEIAKEVALEEGVDEIPLRELKCYSALALYEVYLHEQPVTRANALDYVMCAATGESVANLGKLATKQVAKLAVKSLAKRLIPYVGWGWGVASAAYCISKL